MKQSIVVILFICLSVLLCLGAGEVDAQVVQETVTLPANITVFYNGIPVMLRDANGALTLPITQNGTVYIPIDSAATIIGKDIGYHSSTGTVNIVDNPIRQPLYPKTIITPEKPLKTRELWTNINSTKTAAASVFASSSIVSNGQPKAAGIKVLGIGDTYYVPVRDFFTSLDYNIFWNEMLYGVEIFTPSFYQATVDVKDTTKDWIDVSKRDIYGFKSWCFFNVFRDSGFAYPMKYAGKENEVVQVKFNRSDVAEVIKKEEAARLRIKEIVDSLNLDNLSKKDKVYRINEWICDNFTYCKEVNVENSTTFPRAISRIVSENRQICEGYARMFRDMCIQAGVQAQYLTGYVNTSDGPICHAWLRVLIDGQWYYCDPTLSDGASVHNRSKWVLTTEESLIKARKEYSMAIQF